MVSLHNNKTRFIQSDCVSRIPLKSWSIYNHFTFLTLSSLFYGHYHLCLKIVDTEFQTCWILFQKQLQHKLRNTGCGKTSQAWCCYLSRNGIHCISHDYSYMTKAVCWVKFLNTFPVNSSLWIFEYMFQLLFQALCYELVSLPVFLPVSQ